MAGEGIWRVRIVEEMESGLRWIRSIGMSGVENCEIRGLDLVGVDLFLLRRMRFVGLEGAVGLVGEVFVAWESKVGREFLDSSGHLHQFLPIDRILDNCHVRDKRDGFTVSRLRRDILELKL